jgi:hypothetical protein
MADKKKVVEDWFEVFAADEDQIIMDVKSIDDTSARFECGDGTLIFFYDGDALHISSEGMDSLVDGVAKKFKKLVTNENSPDLHRSLQIFSEISKAAALSALTGESKL